MDYWTAFILGLVGSLHCAGMCGPLALALPSHSGNIWTLLRDRAAYNLGRVATYCGLGFMFGAFGKTLWLAGVQRWLSIVLGVTLLVGLLSSRRLTLWRPVTFLVNRLKSQMSMTLRRRSAGSLAVLGLLNGLLPCGLVYVACAGATATGGITAGVSYMAWFGAGTLPLMLVISFSGRLLPISWRLPLLKAVPLAVFLLATLLILRGMSLGVPFLSPDLANGSCCHRP
jgi:uncharacterized protein